MSEDTVTDLLGAPEEVAEFEADKHFYYWSRCISLFFVADEGGNLSGIEVGSCCRCTLNGQEIFPNKREGVTLILRGLLSQKGVDAAATIVYLEEDGSTRLSSKLLGMDFYFEDGSLASVNWGAIDEEGQGSS